LELLVIEEPQLLQSLTFTGPAGGGGAAASTLAPHFSQNLTPSRRV
jgi:hypothetical protein